MAVIADGSAKFRVRTVFQMPAGAVLPFAGNTIPKGWLLCDGQAVSRADYDELFDVIGTTYGTGDGSTTFNLPNLVDKFVEGGSTIGTVKSAGLPNITGYFAHQAVPGQEISVSGAMYLESYTKVISGLNTGNAWNSNGAGKAVFGLDASKSNSIYGASTTVQPPAIVMKYIIKA